MYSAASTIEAERPRPSSMADLPVVEVQAARAEDLGGEVELRHPVGDHRLRSVRAEEVACPGVHLARYLFGRSQEHRVAVDRQLQVALVLERHGRDLTERVLAVEHPPVGARQERVRDVSDTRRGRCVRTRRRASALNPLPLQVGGNLAALEPAVAGVLDGDARSGDRAAGVEKRDRLPASRALGPPCDPRPHHLFARRVERRECFERRHSFRREHVRVRGKHVRAKFEGGHDVRAYLFRVFAFPCLSRRLSGEPKGSHYFLAGLKGPPYNLRLRT